MTMNTGRIRKNIDFFVKPYGLNINPNVLVREIKNSKSRIEGFGVLLRDPVTGKGLISCQFPSDADVTEQMLWVYSQRVDLKAVLICSKVKTNKIIYTLTKVKDRMFEGSYYIIKEKEFEMRVHQKFRTIGVIEHYDSKKGTGYISMKRRGIFFRQEWCKTNQIKIGQEVSFIPVISRIEGKGLQGRVVEVIK